MNKCVKYKEIVVSMHKISKTPKNNQDRKNLIIFIWRIQWKI